MVDRKTMVISVTGVTFVLAVLLSFAYTDSVLAQKELASKQKERGGKILKKVIHMQGMTCEGCEEMISATGAKVDGVISITASSPLQQAVVEYNTSKTDIETIMKKIAETGYKTLSSEDYKESAEAIPAPAKQMKKDSAMKCGPGKCGAE